MQSVLKSENVKQGEKKKKKVFYAEIDGNCYMQILKA